MVAGGLLYLCSPVARSFLCVLGCISTVRQKHDGIRYGGLYLWTRGRRGLRDLHPAVQHRVDLCDSGVLYTDADS